METWMFVSGLLLMLCLGITSHIANSQFCPPGKNWTYHSHTKTCIIVIEETKQFHLASSECRGYKGGSGGDINGHLVFIKDNNTNNFVKVLIDKAGLNETIIGLNNRATPGTYVWGNVNIDNDVTFTQWSEGEPTNGHNRVTVVMKQGGWKKVPTNKMASFVCQVAAVFPSPTVSCQTPAEIGQPGSPVTCSLSEKNLGNFSNLTIALLGNVLADCKEGSTSCRADPGYQATFNAKDYTSRLTIDKVGRKHEGRYTCAYQFEDIPEKMSNSCQLSVYATPSKPECNHTFTDTGVKVVCVTDKVYPEGGCSWSYRNATFTQDLPATPNVSSQGGPQNEGKYFQTTCTTDVTISKAGSYEFKVIIFPKGFQHISNANNSNEVKVNITPPRNPPILTAPGVNNLPSVFKVSENDTVTITCTVEGGSPPVINTTLICDNEIRDNSSKSTIRKHGQSVTISFRATRDMDGKHCACSASHLSGAYKNTTRVDFSVKYPATVKNFESSVSKPEAGKQVTLNCSANGNPPPTLKILAVKENGNLETLAEDKTGHLSHQMKVSCNDSGEYVCSGKNDLSTTDSAQSLVLWVECKPELCDEKTPQFGVATNKTEIIKLCVFGYPPPTQFTLYPVSEASLANAVSLEKERYKGNFQYRNNKTAQGDITITIRSLQRDDLKDYTINAEVYENGARKFYSYLPFTLVGQGPPSCPTEVQTVKTYSDTVTLSWKPGFNGGPAQTFIIQHQEGNEIAKVKDTEEDTMHYNITGLTENSPYIFSIDVKNDVGKTECPHVFVNVTTKALPVSQDSSQTIYIIIAIIAVVLIVILISIVVFLVKRRRKKKELRQSAEYKAREAGEGESLVRGDEIEDLYASADINTEIGVKSKDAKSEKKKKDKKKDDKEKKKDKVKKKEEEDQDTVEATYAVINKMPKKDKEGAECKAGEAGEGGSLVRGDETEDLYANVDISTEKGVKKKDAKPEKQKKDKKKEDKEKKKDKVKKKEEEDQDTMEATYAVVNKMQNKDKKDTKTKKSATKSKEDKKKQKEGGTEKPKDEVEVVIENDLYVKNSDLDNAEVVLENDLYAKSSDLGNAEVVIENDLYGKSSDLGNAEVVIENDLYGKSSDLGNAEVVIENDLYAKSSDLDKAEVVIENDLYGKSSDLTAYSNVEMCAGGQPDPPDESVYANETATSPPGQTLKSKEKEGKKGKKEEKKAEKDSGRTVNADGLVYVTVEINPTTKKPEAKSDVPATSGATQPSKPKSKYDPVEYVVLDHTAKVNTEGKKEGSA